jgi:hypothetical protein
MAGFKMDDYVDVAERIREFYERFPEGTLKGQYKGVVEAGGKSFVVYHAQAYRNATDSLCSDGWAWEPVPGPTSFTKDSELQNAETAAWGRAIVALGFETKKIASKQEVRNRRTENPVQSSPQKKPPSFSEIDDLTKAYAEILDKPRGTVLEKLAAKFPEWRNDEVQTKLAVEHMKKLLASGVAAA